MRFNPRYERRLPQERSIELQRIVSALLLIVLVAITITYSFGVTRPEVATISEVSGKYFGLFTPNAIMTFDVFVGVMYFAQFAYLIILLSTKNEALLISATEGVSYHFILYSLLQGAQVATWAHELFAVTQICLVSNLANLLILYLRLGPTPHLTTIRKNVYLQIPLVKMPLALTIFWLWQNTTALLKEKGVASIIDHVGIWILGLVLAAITFVPRDSLFGLAGCYLMFSLGTEQFTHRLTATACSLQYNFAFSIASALFCITTAVGVPRFRYSLNLEPTAEHAPLLG